jgi:two-component system, LytTR family, sensor kinase
MSPAMETTPDNPAPPAWSRARMSLVWAASVAAFGLLLFSYRYLGVLASGGHEPYQRKLVEEMTAALVGGSLFFPIRRLVRARPLSRDNWPQLLPLYALLLVAAGVASTTLMWAVRSAVYPLAGLGTYRYGRMPLIYLMELPLQAIAYSVMVLAILAVDGFREAHERQVRAARLESSLAQAQLRNLRLQLQPHFLFNALNTISSTMYRDPAAADEMIAQLAELLRASLHTAQTDEVALEAELAILDQYLGIMRARFGDRLLVRLAIDAGVRSARVPSMVLQPLVENAIRHGNASRAGCGAVEVRARREDDDLVLEVEDDGPGSEAALEESAWGVGLTATRDRLRLLYGDGQRFDAGYGAAGGFLVRARFPFRPAATEAA